MGVQSGVISSEPTRHVVQVPRSVRWFAWLIYTLITLLIVVRFFTEQIPILPRVLNAVDLITVPLLFPLWAVWMLPKGRWVLKGKWQIVLSVLFFIFWMISWAVNSAEVHWLGALLLVVGLLTPIMFYLILINTGVDECFCYRMVRLLTILLLVNLVIGTGQAVRGLGTGNPDFVFGTFGVNQNQMALFLAFMITYLLAQWRYEGMNLLRLALLGWASILFLLCGFQTLWIVLAAAVGLVFFVLARLSRRLVLIGALATLLPLVVLPQLDFARFTFGPMLQVAVSNFDRLGKVVLIRNVPDIWESRSWAFWVGTGPGTFNSRAFRSIAIIPVGAGSSTDVAGAIVAPFYTSELSSHFIIPYFVRGTVYVLGSDVGGPFTSYLSVPLEMGLFGALCLFGIYGMTIQGLIRSLRWGAQPRQRTLAAWGLMNMLILLGIAVADNYLEVTRYTLLVWLSVALWQIYTRVTARSGAVSQSGS